MIILLNPKAAGGAARWRWERIRSQVVPEGDATRTYLVVTPNRLRDVLARELARGETEFVAAGGDGTLNRALNALLGVAGTRCRADVALGAVGLGSSNDFHKPLSGRERIGGVPVSLRFSEARPRDVGRLTIDDGGRERQRHFLVSASVGFAARANRRFNRPSPLLRLLKRVSTRASIHAVVLRTLLGGIHLPATIRVDDEPEARLSLTNLSVLLTPHIGGVWRCDASRQAGQLGIHLCRSLSRIGLFRVLGDLQKGQVTPSPRVSVRCAETVSVEAARSFDVEFDGEVLRGRRVRFEVLRDAVKVCP